jgi:catechol 2,3-dioxygenase-like lactoylglutathione lyase family enzyme
MDMKLEVVVLGVSDVDRAKAFYEKLGWRLDADFVTGDEFRVIQFTPPNSQASIIFGKGVPSPKPGSVQSLTLAVDNIEAARKKLDWSRREGDRGVSIRRRPIQQHWEKPAGQRPRSTRAFLFFICIIRGSGRERLLAPGNQNAPSRTRMAIGASGKDRHRNTCRTPSRNRTASRQLREDARKT